MAESPKKPTPSVAHEEALRRATEILSGSRKRLLDWMSDEERRWFVGATLAVLVIALTLDGFGGRASTMADHLIDLAKFVLPTALASSAAAHYTKSRLLCCVMEHAGESTANSEG